MADCKDGNSDLLYPVYYPVVAVYQFSYVLIAGLRERAATLRECLEAAHFVEDGLNPLFRCGGIIACYVLRYLGNPLDCKGGPEDLHLLIRFSTAAIASSCSIPLPSSIWPIDAWTS